MDNESIYSFIGQTRKNALRQDLSPSHVSGHKLSIK